MSAKYSDRIPTVKLRSGGELPSFQAQPTAYYTPGTTIYSAPSVPSALLSGTAKFRIIVPKSTVRKVEGVTLRFHTTVGTSATQISPVTSWFYRVVLPGQDSGTDNAVLFGDALLANILHAVPGSQWPCVCQPLNILGDKDQNALGITRTPSWQL